MHLRLGAVEPDPWIVDGEGERVFQVDENALARLRTFILRDLHGREVAKLQEESALGPDAIAIRREGDMLATVRRTHAFLGHRFLIDVDGGVTLQVHGHPGRHDYEIRRDAQVVATISTRWSRADDHYGVEVAAAEDEAMLLAATVAIEDLDHR